MTEFHWSFEWSEQGVKLVKPIGASPSPRAAMTEDGARGAPSIKLVAYSQNVTEREEDCGKCPPTQRTNGDRVLFESGVNL